MTSAVKSSSHRATFAQQVIASVTAWKSETNLLKLLEFLCDLCETSAIRRFCFVLKPAETSDFKFAAVVNEEANLLTDRSSNADLPRQYSSRPSALVRSKTSPNLLFGSNATAGGETGRQNDNKPVHTAESIAREIDQFQVLLMQRSPTEIPHLFASLIKLLTPSGMSKLRNLLLQKLRQRTSIQTVPDRLLVRIFSYLSASDLRACSQVSRRWHFVVSSSELWMRKCEHLAAANGLLSYLATRRRGAPKADFERIYAELEKVLSDATRRTVLGERTERHRQLMLKRLDEDAMRRRSLRRRSSSTAFREDDNEPKAKEVEGQEEVAVERNYDEFFDEQGQFQLPEWLIDRRPLMQSLIGLKKNLLHSQDVAIDSHRSLDFSQMYGSLHNHEVRDVISCRVFVGHLQSVLCSAADRSRLITGSSDYSIRIWDKRTGATVHKLCGHSGPVTSVAFAGDFLCSSSWDCTVQFWNLLKFERVACVKQHTDVVSRVRIAPNGRHSYDNLLTAGYDGILEARNLQTLTSYARIDYNRLFKSTKSAGFSSRRTSQQIGVDIPTEERFSPAGIIEMFVRNSHPSLVYTAHADCQIRQADLRIASVTSQFSIFDSQLSILARNELATPSNATGWQTLNVSGRNNTASTQNTLTLRSVVPHADRPNLFYALTANHVLLFDERLTTKPVHTFRLARCVDDVQATSIVAMPHHHVMVGFSDGEMVQYDSMKMIALRSLLGHKGAVRQISLGKTCLFSASDDYQARIWQLSKTPSDPRTSGEVLPANRSAFAVKSFYAALQKVRTTD